MSLQVIILLPNKLHHPNSLLVIFMPEMPEREPKIKTFHSYPGQDFAMCAKDKDFPFIPWARFCNVCL